MNCAGDIALGAPMMTLFDAYAHRVMRANQECMEAACRVFAMKLQGVHPGDIRSAERFMDDTIRAMAVHVYSLQTALLEGAWSVQ